jgi:RNA polymerase sigma-70 factor (ECF subfamily)
MRSPGEELDLIRRLANGDEGALAHLYDRFSRPIYSMVLKMLGNERDAEEIVQDVFISLWKNAQTFDSAISSPFTWLAAVARNKTIDRIRSSQRRIPPPPAAEPDSAHEPAAATASPAEESAANDRARVIAEWIGELPQNQREAIELAFFEGLTHPEIAERLRETIGTVKSRIRLGMDKLRGRMKGGLE